MWFKQVQIFELPNATRFSPESLNKQLEPLTFTPCLPSFPSSMGWISPHDEDGGFLIRAINNCIMICLQIEEKILPATVVRQALHDKIKEIESDGTRKVYQKEKMALKDEIIMTLLPRAFSRFTKVYAYIDTKNNWLVMNTVNAKKIEQFLSMFKKSVTDDIHPLEVEGIAATMTHWVSHQSYPSIFGIEKSCVLQDPDQQSRVIRCQQQDLISDHVRAFIKDGCKIKQLAISWQDHIEFTLTEVLTLQSIKYQDQILEQTKDLDIETKQQQFDANFMIMSQTLSPLLVELVNIFTAENVEAAVA